jgi:hypothetical protein
MAVQAVKIAIILAALDWAENYSLNVPVIELRHWVRAQQIAERWRASLHRLLADLSRTQDIRSEEAVLDFLAYPHEKPPTRREIHLGTRLKTRRDCYLAIDALVEGGEIVEVERQGERGPKTVGYQLSDVSNT